MKKIILTILISIATNTYASDFKMEYCTATSEFASLVMETRQAGTITATKLLSSTSSLKNPQTKDGNLLVVMNAYKEPLWPSNKSKVRAIKEYSNEVFLDCMDDINKYYKIKN